MQAHSPFYRLRSKLGSKSWEQLGQWTQKLLNGSQVVGMGCFLGWGDVLVPHCAWCWMWDMRALTGDGAAAGRGYPLLMTHSPAHTSVPKLLAELHWSQQGPREPLSIRVGGTSGNGLVWKGVECCNFEYWGYWSYGNVAFYFRSKIMYLFWNVC